MGRGEYATLIAKIEAGAREAGIELPKGASPAAIAELEETLSLTLPDEVKAWFLAHDGGGSQFALENRELLSLERIADEWKIWKDLLDKGVFGENAHSEPGRGVQQKWWIPEWVPSPTTAPATTTCSTWRPPRAGTTARSCRSGTTIRAAAWSGARS